MFVSLPSYQRIIAECGVKITKVRLPQLQEKRGCSIKCDPYFQEIRSVLKQAWAGARIFIQPIPGKDKRKMNEVKGFA
jgi:hypothetical protein